MTKYWIIACFILGANIAARAQSWKVPGGGVSKTVYNFAPDTINGYLYASGSFKEAGGITCNCVARWDGQQWDSLAAGVIGCGSSRPFAMVLYKGELYVYGSLVTPGDLARWNGSAWEYVAKPKGGHISDFVVHEDTLYIIGEFDSIGEVYSPRVIKYDGNEFYTVISEWPFTTYGIGGMAMYKDQLYIGGSFFEDGEGAIQHLAQWSGSEWKKVGGAEFHGSFAGIADMVVYNDQLVIGGFFEETLGAPGNSIAAWDGESWHSMGTGLGGVTNPQVRQLKVHDGKLYVVGIFRSADNASARSMAVWDGERWCGIEGEIQSSVTTIDFFDDKLFIGGSYFGNIGVDGEFIKHIAYLEDYQNKEDSCSWPVGVRDVPAVQPGISVYPNPIESTLYVQGLDGQVPFTLMTLTGEVVGSGVVHDGKGMDLGYLPAGVYLLRIQAGQPRVLKIVKR